MCVMYTPCCTCPLARQKDCDQQMRDNTHTIHWDNSTGLVRSSIKEPRRRFNGVQMDWSVVQGVFYWDQ